MLYYLLLYPLFQTRNSKCVGYTRIEYSPIAGGWFSRNPISPELPHSLHTTLYEIPQAYVTNYLWSTYTGRLKVENGRDSISFQNIIVLFWLVCKWISLIIGTQNYYYLKKLCNHVPSIFSTLYCLTCDQIAQTVFIGWLSE